MMALLHDKCNSRSPPHHKLQPQRFQLLIKSMRNQHLLHLLQHRSDTLQSSEAMLPASTPLKTSAGLRSSDEARRSSPSYTPK